MADSRILIKTIQIKNFRSIRTAKIDCRNMNIFVGQNDVGKSNPELFIAPKTTSAR